MEMFLITKFPVIIITSTLIVSVLFEYVCCYEPKPTCGKKIRNVFYFHPTTTIITAVPYYKRYQWLKRVPVLRRLCYPFFRFKKFVNICYKRYENYVYNRDTATTINPFHILRFWFLTRTPPSHFWIQTIKAWKPSLFRVDNNLDFDFLSVPDGPSL